MVVYGSLLEVVMIDAAHRGRRRREAAVAVHFQESRNKMSESLAPPWFDECLFGDRNVVSTGEAKSPCLSLSNVLGFHQKTVRT
jgi:hypothetical protein